MRGDGKAQLARIERLSLWHIADLQVDMTDHRALWRTLPRTTGGCGKVRCPSVICRRRLRVWHAAAIDIQERMARFNDALSEEQRMLFRIGVHLGEVIIDDEDQNIFGDGVNLAARIQTLAEECTIRSQPAP